MYPCLSLHTKGGAVNVEPEATALLESAIWWCTAMKYKSTYGGRLQNLFLSSSLESEMGPGPKLLLTLGALNIGLKYLHSRASIFMRNRMWMARPVVWPHKILFVIL